MLKAAELCTGLFLVRGGAILPACLGDESDLPDPEWNARKGLTNESLKKELDAAGWVVYNYAGQITTTGFARTLDDAAEKALSRLTKIVGSRDCNCIELVDVQSRGITGMRHITLVGLSRHIQKGIRAVK